MKLQHGLISAFVFRHLYSIIPFFKIQNSKFLAIFSGFTAWFLLDLVRNPKDRLSCEEAHSCAEKFACTAGAILVGWGSGCDWLILMHYAGSIMGVKVINSHIC